MKRYIDADEVRKRLLSYYDSVNESTAKDNYRGETLMNYEVAQMIENCIEETPTADVQEVRHGKWLESRCSECGRGAVFQDVNGIWRLENYCPHCGAKMDGGLK